ncbi:hypothetical protein HZB96_05045 [Candidatus Gottesmanbacteria bacterium]|nr:hypothetical protein [Candidatus Gottesmanbacteria bacterium]
MKYLSDYLHWHYIEAWRKIFIVWRNLTLFPYYYFSISLHLSHLFNPWKRQRIKMGVGFHLDEFFGVVAFNIISRILGAIIKLTVICYGLIFMVVLAIVWAIPVISWPLIPIITLPFYLGRGSQKGKEAEYYLKIASGDINKLVYLLSKNPMGKFIAIHLGLEINVIAIPSLSREKQSLQSIEIASSSSTPRNDN